MRNEPDVLRVGIAGMGFMGVTHLGAFSKIPNVAIAAIGTSNPQVLAGDLSQAAGNLSRTPVEVDLSAVRKYTAWPEMLRADDLDAIDICLPTHLHSSATVAALEAGKDVLCEKPMAGTVAECKQIIEAAGKAGHVLMIAQVLRFWPEYEFLLDFVKNRPYGAILSATFTRRCGIPAWSRWLTDESMSGGAILDLLVHDIDQILLLFGMPERVAAKKIADPDAVAATFLYKDRVEVRLQGGWFAVGTPFAMGFQVRSENALLDWNAQGLTISTQDGKRSPVEVSGHDPYGAEIEYFVECCRTGARPARCPPEDSARAVQLALLVKESKMAGGAQLKCSV